MQVKYALLSKEKTIAAAQWVTESKTGGNAAAAADKLQLLNGQTEQVRNDFKKLLATAKDWRRW